MNCLFVSDIHGNREKYGRLFEQIGNCRPDAVFLGGDLLPADLVNSHFDFFDYLRRELEKLRLETAGKFLRIFAIMGNDDQRTAEPSLLELDKLGLIEYIHGKKVAFGEFTIYGYAYVPPTPFRLKDWERYDLSRYIDPGSVSPEDGHYSAPLEKRDARFSTIKKDLDTLASRDDLSHAIFLFHAPPYDTNLDRMALEGIKIDGVPLDSHVGSIAIRRFIESRQPLLTLHGHIHESARLSGSWKDLIGHTLMLSAAHDGPELALIHFSPEAPGAAYRELI